MIVVMPLYAQAIYKSSETTVSFFAGTSIEDINAVSTKATSFFNTQSGEVIVNIPMTSFQFDRSLMKDHFNENYVESEKYPKAEFKGTIRNNGEIDWQSLSAKTVLVDGTLTMHGVSKIRTLEVQISSVEKGFVVTSDFYVPLADHNIDRPQLLWEKLADQVEVKVKIIYAAYKPVSPR